MNDQIIILLLLIFSILSTLFLYFWKAKKEIQYRKDERWQLIQNRASIVAGYLLYVVIVLLAVIDTVSLYWNLNVTITLNRALVYVTCFIGIRNSVEVFALLHFDKKL